MGERRFRARSVLWAVSALAAIGIVCLWAGDRPTLLGRGGKRAALVAEAPVRNLGRVRPAVPARPCFRIQNVSSHIVTIIGVEVACGCMSTDFEPPRQVRAGEAVTVTVRLNPPNQKGAFQRDLTVYTDDTEQRALKLSVKAVVTGPDGPP